MTVFHGDDQSSVAGTATYHTTKKHGVATASDIILQLSSGTTSFNKEGGLFSSSDKRTLQSAELGEVHWQGGGSFSQTVFFKLVDANGKSLVEYKDMRVDSKMGTMDIHAELRKEALDKVVVSGMAMLSEERASTGASALAINI